MKMRKVFQAAIMLVLSFGPLPCSFGQIWLELGGNFTVGSGTKYLGRFSVNPFSPDSTGNPYGLYGSPFSSMSINSPFSPYGSWYSNSSVANPFATEAPRIFAQDGTYLGRLSKNQFESESISNPFGQFGSQFSPTSITNPSGIYGSRFSYLSPNNPFTITAPIIIGDEP